MIEHTDPFYQKIASTIELHGRQLLAIGAGAKEPAFAYSIGNHLKGFPELLIIGNMQPEIAQSILNKLSDQVIAENKAFLNGALVNIGGKFDLQVWDTTIIAKVQYTLQATEFYRHQEYAVQQIILPDPKGHYPTDKRCHKRYRVPVLRSTTAIMQSLKIH